MTNLTAICLCVLLWASCPESVPRKLFDAVSENTGVAFDYDNPEHREIVSGLIKDTAKNNAWKKKYTPTKDSFKRNDWMWKDGNIVFVED
jgi:hypothetical protein